LLHLALLIKISKVSISKVCISKVSISKVGVRSYSACVENNTSFKTAYTLTMLVGALASSLISRLLGGLISLERGSYTRP
jgi:hypothetical protein